MSELRLDPFAGISGDMFLGALVDVGLPIAALRADLKKLKLRSWSITAETVMRGAMQGTHVKVRVADVHHPHRGLNEIKNIIRASSLPSSVQERALAVFTKLGQVEAGIHHVPLSRIHFHEVGALDAVVDIVGVCAGLERLGVEQVWTGPVNVGSGMIQAGHGWLPVPAPATLELLKGFEIFSAGPASEHTTPTGAALLAVLAKSARLAPGFVPANVGYGAGTREWTDFPNLLRAVLVQSSARGTKAPWVEESVCVLTANLDDATPQLLGYVMECLLAAGALDVSFQALQMKKNRPGQRLEVIGRPEDATRLAGIMFRETPTLGVRVEVPRRLALRRKERTVRVLGHPIRLKIAHGEKGVATVTPEYEDVKACAHAENKSWRAVAQKAMAQAKEIL